MDFSAKTAFYHTDHAARTCLRATGYSKQWVINVIVAELGDSGGYWWVLLFWHLLRCDAEKWVPRLWWLWFFF